MLKPFPCVSVLLLAALLLSACGTVPTNLQQAGQLAAGEPMPIDGRWRMSPGGQSFTFGKSHAWAEDPYTAGVYSVQKGDVVTRGLHQTGARTFEGWDILWNARWEGTLQDDGTLAVTLHTLVPAQLTFTPVKLDQPGWHTAQLASTTVVPNPRPAAAPKAFASPGAPSPSPSAPSAALSSLPAGEFGRYHALVIGNDSYQNFDVLQTARSDAQAVAALLEQEYGFETKVLLDATRADILVALADLRKRMTAADNLLIYYAGHGWLDEAGDEGYWLPVDATPDNVVNWVANSAITSYFKSIEAKHILVVADSCYSGTLTRGIQVKDRTPSHIQRMAERKARVVLTSGGIEPVADSGGREGHSAFASAFLDALQANDGVLDTATLYSQIRRPVMLAADQAPDIADIRKAGHEGGDFLFVRSR